MKFEKRKKKKSSTIIKVRLDSCEGWFQEGGGDTSGAWPIRMQNESACKPIKSLLSLLTQWTWSSSTNGIPDPCSARRDKHRLSDHLMCCMRTHTRTQMHAKKEREAQMPAYDSVLRDHIDANEANARHVIAQAEAPRSPGWKLSCQWLIPSASHPFLFFFPQTWFPYLPKALESSHLSFSISPSSLSFLCQPISSGWSGNDANYRKEADVTAKHPCDGEESSCVASPQDSNYSSLISCISDTGSFFFFFVIPHFWFFGPPIIFSRSHILGCQMCELPVFCICSSGNLKHSSCGPAYGDR